MAFGLGLKCASISLRQFPESKVCRRGGLGLKLCLLLFLANREVVTFGWRGMLFRTTGRIAKEWLMRWEGILFCLALLILERGLMGDR